MKKLFYFLAVAGTAFFTSCSDDDSQTNNPEATSLIVTPSASTVVVGSTVTFTVKDNLGEIVTQDATLYLDGEALEDNSVVASEAGTYTVHAELGDLESADITITVTDTAATSITVLLSAGSVNVGQAVSFIAKTNQDADVTAEAVFYVNDEAIEGHTFTPDAAGDYTVHAVYGELASADGTFTAEAEAEVPVADNSIVFDGVEYTTDGSILVYLGSDTTQNLSYWIANSFIETEEGYPNDVYLYFATEQLSDTNIELPTPGTFDFGNAGVDKLYNMQIFLDFENVVESKLDVAQGEMNLVAFTGNDTAANWDYNYELVLTNGTIVSGDYHGDWGYMDGSEGGGADRHAASAAKVKNVSKSTLANNRVNAISKMKRK